MERRTCIFGIFLLALIQMSCAFVIGVPKGSSGISAGSSDSGGYNYRSNTYRNNTYTSPPSNTPKPSFQYNSNQYNSNSLQELRRFQYEYEWRQQLNRNDWVQRQRESEMQRMLMTPQQHCHMYGSCWGR
jgi:hypothetical protein